MTYTEFNAAYVTEFLALAQGITWCRTHTKQPTEINDACCHGPLSLTWFNLNPSMDK